MEGPTKQKKICTCSGRQKLENQLGICSQLIVCGPGSPMQCVTYSLIIPPFLFPSFSLAVPFSTPAFTLPERKLFFWIFISSLKKGDGFCFWNKFWLSRLSTKYQSEKLDNQEQFTCWFYFQVSTCHPQARSDHSLVNHNEQKENLLWRGRRVATANPNTTKPYLFCLCMLTLRIMIYSVIHIVPWQKSEWKSLFIIITPVITNILKRGCCLKNLNKWKWSKNFKKRKISTPSTEVITLCFSARSSTSAIHSSYYYKGRKQRASPKLKGFQPNNEGKKKAIRQSYTITKTEIILYMNSNYTIPSQHSGIITLDDFYTVVIFHLIIIVYLFLQILMFQLEYNVSWTHQWNIKVFNLKKVKLVFIEKSMIHAVSKCICTVRVK